MPQLKGVQKIAVLLAVLGEEAAARVLSCFEDDEQERVGQAMVELEDTDISDEVVQVTIDEFKALIQSGVVFRSHLGKTLNSVMNRIHGQEEATKRLARIHEEAKSRHPFRPLRLIKGSDLARILRDEHAQVQALVLSNLEPEQAADILNAMPEAVRPDLVSRMATLDEPSARLLKQVAQEMVERTRGLPRMEEAAGPVDDSRVRAVADVLNVAPATSKEILRIVEEGDADLSQRIRERMFTWVDLKALDKRTMQKILAGIDTKLLAVALKGSEKEVTDVILGATSQRTRDMILEEKELLGAMPLAEVLEAQKQILTAVRDLASGGEISVSKGRQAAYVQ